MTPFMQLSTKLFDDSSAPASARRIIAYMFLVSVIVSAGEGLDIVRSHEE